MNESPQIMTLHVNAHRVDETVSVSRANQAEFQMDTGMAGRPDAMNPMELLLSALAACMIKGIERVAPTLGLDYSSVDIALTAHRPMDEARISDISYVITVGTSADENKLELLHKNLMKFGTIYNTVKAGTSITGTIAAA